MLTIAGLTTVRLPRVQVEHAVRRLVEMMSLPGHGAPVSCLHELAIRAAWQLSSGSRLFQLALVRTGVVGALCDLTVEAAPPAVRRPAAVLAELLLAATGDADHERRLQVRTTIRRVRDME